MEKIEFQLGSEVQLFKTDLVAMVDSASSSLIIRQPNAGFNAPGMTIEVFLNEIKNLFEQFLGEGAIPDVKLPEAINKVIEGISVSLKEIFLLVKTTDPKSVEFAIWVSMEASDKLQKMFLPIAIKQGYLKVWNTSIPVILDEMQILTLQSLFQQGTETPKIAEDKSGQEQAKK